MFRVAAKAYIVAMVALAIGAGGASAQSPAHSPPTVTFTATPLEGLLEPGSQHGIELSFQASCSTPPDALGPVTVEFAARVGSPFAHIELSRTTADLDTWGDRCATPGYSRQIKEVAVISLDRAAPAYVPIAVAFEATLTQGTEVFGPYVVQFNATPDYAPGFHVFSDHIIMGKPGKVYVVPLRFESRSNGASIVAMQLVPSNPLNLTVDPSPSWELGAMGTDNAIVTKVIRGKIAPDRQTWGFEEIVVTAEMRARDNTSSRSAVDTLVVGIQIPDDPPFQAPAPSFPWLLLGVAALALVRRRAP